jgi:membrane protease YdiL (CAAX protease family)
VTPRPDPGPGQRASWRARADEALLVSMPPRRRIVLEVALLLVLVFGEGALMVSLAVGVVVVAAALALAMALVRPWARVHGGAPARVAATVLCVVAVVAPAMVEHPGIGASRRLGIEIAVGSHAEGDPDVEGGIVLVQKVEPGLPADGVLRAGDRIVALAGAPFDRADPTGDLSSRTHGDELPEDTTVTVLRDGTAQDLAVRIPRVHSSRESFGRRVVAIRQLSSRHIVFASAIRGALLIALLLLIVRADGQPLAAIGIARAGALRELLAASGMTMGAFGLQIAIAIPIAVIGSFTGIVGREAAQRTQTLGVLTGQGSIPESLLAIIVAAAFEEVAFRGFLVPRLRTLTGSWPLAVALASVAFGLGHRYEGAFAVVQTAFLGAYFAALFLLRRRLLGPIAAHAGFNAVMFLVVQWLVQSGVVERLREMSPR